MANRAERRKKDRGLGSDLLTAFIHDTVFRLLILAAVAVLYVVLSMWAFLDISYLEMVDRVLLKR
jgi:hypothetical protein